MRFTRKAITHGTTRFRKKFLWLPQNTTFETRWLEFAFVEERWYNNSWCFLGFLTEAEYEQIKKNREGQAIAF